MRRSPRRAAFFCGALAELDASLQAHGARLIVRRGGPLSAPLALARETKADAVVWSAGYDARSAVADRALQHAVEERGLRALLVHDAPAVAPEATTIARSADGAGYRAFASYLTAWQTAPRSTVTVRARFSSDGVARDPLPVPASFGTQLDPAADASEEGATAALERFLLGPAVAYATNRNVPALDTSRLSAHLSFGTIAARTVLARTDERAADPFLLAEERRSLETFKHALARRDFFLQLAWCFERTADEPLQDRMHGFRFARTHAALAAWRAGATGFPLVDAGMRELLATGTMHPRARAVAASFLCFDLGVDWRVGRDVWDRLLTEDDSALATGNWQWIAGVGADLAQFPRIYNPRRQARRLDPAGTYVRRWIPELAGVPTADVFDPHAASAHAQLPLRIFGGDEYPAPVVDHDASARAFLRRYVNYVRRVRPVPKGTD